MMSYAEIYERLYLNGWSDKDRDEARDAICNMSTDDWHGWVEYRNKRQGKIDDPD